MKYMESTKIRNMFLSFFEERGHEIIPSSSLIPKDDPSLLWNNAGVTPLKKYFDGTVVPNNKRITSSQKCLRTNDIESVGDYTHHTFFEMLGNFSIGDYFKKEALEMAFELLTGEKYFGFDLDKLYMTIYPTDQETKQIWMDLGVKEDHIIPMEGNFWCIGEGPCGPDSEIFYDRGGKYDKEGLGIRLLTEDIPNHRYVEIWNNVFSQYNAKEGKKIEEYEELPNKNIDTGMGLERMACILQEKDSNYDTDLFLPIIEKIEEISNIKYNDSKEFRIISDHIRTLTFTIGDGAAFSNESRGYVIRRLLRRAYRCGKKLGIKKPFLHELVDTVIEIMKDHYSYLIEKRDYIKELILKEEILFEKTLASGEKRLEELMNASSDNTISGFEAFKLYDTYGFPFELTLEYLEEKGFSVSKEEFDIQMENQKNLARTSRKNEISMNSQNRALLNYKEISEFVGYEKLETTSKVIGLFIKDKEVNELSDEGYAIFDSTPFYAEKGGQVGDSGYIFNDNLKAEVIDVVVSPNKQNLHIVNVLEGSLKLGDVVNLKVNGRRRESIEKNHSVTHLLHESLKEVLDESLVQAGSRVDEYSTRFDFSYNKKIDEKDIILAETLVNEKISTASETIVEYMDLNSAKEQKAVALFEEKYDNVVRVVTMFDSKELCGGTHVKNTSLINKFAIKSFFSIGSNTYRIEGVTDVNIENQLYKEIKPYNDEMIKLLEKAKNIMDIATNEGISLNFNVKVDNSKPQSYKDILLNRKELENIKISVKKLEKEYLEEKLSKSLDNIDEFLSKIETNNFKYLITKVNDYDNIILKNIVDRILEHMGNGFIFVANVKNDNVNYIAKSTKNININCGEIIKSASLKSNGSGGGNPTFGQGGGSSISNIDTILKEITMIVKNN